MCTSKNSKININFNFFESLSAIFGKNSQYQTPQPKEYKKRKRDTNTNESIKVTKKRKKSLRLNSLTTPLKPTITKTPTRSSRKLEKLKTPAQTQAAKRKKERLEISLQNIQRVEQNTQEIEILKEDYEKQKCISAFITLIKKKNKEIANLCENLRLNDNKLKKNQEKHENTQQKLEKNVASLSIKLTDRRAATKDAQTKLARSKHAHKMKINKMEQEIEKHLKFIHKQQEAIIDLNHNLDDLEDELDEIENKKQEAEIKNKALLKEFQKYEEDLEEALEKLGHQMKIDEEEDEYVDKENQVKKISTHPCYKNGKEFSGVFKLLVGGICSQGRCSTRSLKIIFPLIKKFAIACEKSGHKVSDCLIEPSPSTVSRYTRHVTPFVNELYIAYRLGEINERVPAANLHHDATRKHRNDLLVANLTFPREQTEIDQLEEQELLKRKRRKKRKRKKGYKDEISYGKTELRIKQDTLTIGIERIPDGTVKTSKSALIKRIEKTEKNCATFFNKKVNVKQKVNKGFIIQDKCNQAVALSKELQKELAEGDEKASLWYCLCHKDHSKLYNKIYNNGYSLFLEFFCDAFIISDVLNLSCFGHTFLLSSTFSQNRKICR